MTSRKPYPSDVREEEWAFVAPYLTLMSTEVPQRHHDLLEVFNGLRYIVKTGIQWRWMPHDLPLRGGSLPADPPLAGGRLLRDGTRRD